MASLQKFEAFMRQHAHIRYATPYSPDYAELRQAYILGTKAVPLAIARPKTAADVALLVSYAVTEGIGITVRSGGHDLFGRCFAQDALAIDMRDIAFANVDAGSASATIGGGILAGDLAEKLSAQRLATAFGSFPEVGYVGWATHGGYGPFVANYGLGVDQILAAKLVNGSGQLVEADAAMLEAIRGGGGVLGVIVEMTIKVYPLDQVLGGVVIFKCEDLTTCFKTFTAGFQALEKEGLPDVLGVQQSFFNTPEGKAFVFGFVWSSNDLTLGRQWLDKIVRLAGEDVLMNTVVPTTAKEFLHISAELVPKSAYGGNCTISVREMTDEITTIVGQQIALMPTDPAALFTAHQLRGKSARPSPGSVFGSRTPHYVFEFIATAGSPEQAVLSYEWAVGFREAVQRSNAKNLLPGTYISLTPPADADFPAIYGSHWQRLKEIKEQYDSENIFWNSMPQFRD